MPTCLLRAATLLFAGLGAACGPEETQHTYGAPTAEQEVALGLQAAPAFAERYGGLIDPEDGRAIAVANAGDLLSGVAEGPVLPFGVEFYLLADSVNADLLSLPGGQVFITLGLLSRLRGGPAELIPVLAHEVGHLLRRHALIQLSTMEIEGHSGAAVLARYAPEDQRSRTSDEIRAATAALMHLQYTEAEEMEADESAIALIGSLVASQSAAAADTAPVHLRPAALADVLHRLLRDEAGARAPAFLRTHPITTVRLARLNAILKRDVEESKRNADTR